MNLRGDGPVTGARRDDTARLGPCLVVASGGQADRASAVLASAGWRLGELDQLRSGPWNLSGRRTLARAPAGTPADQTLWLRTRGSALVVEVGRGLTSDALVRDLARVGPIEDWRHDPTHPTDALSPDQWAVLGPMVEGATVTEAAGRAHVSRRTAHRRLTDITTTLGLRSTTEAIARAGQRLQTLGDVAPLGPPGALFGRAGEIAGIVDVVARGHSVVVHAPRGQGLTALVTAAAAGTGRRWRRAAALELLTDQPVVTSSLLGRAVTGGSARQHAAELGSVLGDAVLVIDDAGWLDPFSAEVLGHLSERTPMIVAVAGDPGQGGAPWLTSAATVEVPPLPTGDVVAVVRSLDPALSRDLAEEVVAVARRNPRRAAELSHPGALRRATGAAAEHLLHPPTLRTAASLVALAHAPVPVASLPDDAAGPLAASGLVLVDGAAARPAGPTARSALRRLVDPDVVRGLHRRLAEALDAPVAVAEHLLAAGDDESARILVTALLGEPISPPLRSRALSVLARTADGHQLVAIIEQAVRSLMVFDTLDAAADLLAEVLDQHPHLASLPDVIAIDGGLRAHRGDVTGGLAVIQNVLDRGGLSPSEEIRLGMVKGIIHIIDGEDISKVVQAASLVHEDPGRDDDRPDVLSRVGPGLAAAFTGDPSWPQALYPVLLDAMARADERPGITDTQLGYLGHIMAFLICAYGDLTGSIEVLDRIIARLAEIGASGMADQLRLTRAFTWVSVHGPTDDARASLRRHLVEGPPQQLTRPAWLALATAEADRGNIDEAMGIVAAVEADAGPSRNDTMGESTWALARAEVAYSAGDSEAVVAERASIVPSFFPTATQHAALVYLAMLDVGRLEPIEVPASVFPIAGWVPHLVESVTRLLEDDPIAAVTAARTALAQRAIFGREEQRIRWVLGEALGRAGETEEAITVLRLLEKDVVTAGLQPLLGRVRASLRALGESTGRGRRPGPSGLTAREVEMLRLVGSGRTSAQIADHLRVSRSTVDTTVQRAMRKLDARTRREAAAWATAE